jgi:hypothetical protein
MRIFFWSLSLTKLFAFDNLVNEGRIPEEKSREKGFIPLSNMSPVKFQEASNLALHQPRLKLKSHHKIRRS